MGAHNQRSQIRVEAIFKNNSLLWIEDLAVVIEREASAPTYPILKRPDEKYVTELGYMNAKFSEDIARDLQLALEACPEIAEWSLKVRNEESIHPYDVASYQSSKNWRYH
jgi:GTP cyclohydrolase I